MPSTRDCRELLPYICWNKIMKDELQERDELLEKLCYCDLRTDIGVDAARKHILKTIRRARMEGAIEDRRKRNN